MRLTSAVWLLLLLSVARAGEEVDPDAEIAAGRAKLPGLSLTLEVEERAYALGEPIPVTMRYTYEGERTLAVWRITYNRCGRIVEFGFRAAGEDGTPVRDSIADWLGGSMGGLRTWGPLGPKEPYEQTVFLNEWLVFDRPGRYRVTALSNIVEFDQTGDSQCDGPTIPLESEPVEIVLIEPEATARKTRLDLARSKLHDASDEERERAMQALRFLNDPRAIPDLVEGLFDPSGNVGYEAYFGLLSFADLQPVRKAILARVASGTFKASDIGFLGWIVTAADLQAQGIEGGWQSPTWRKARRESEAKWREELRSKLRGRIDDLTGAERARALVNAMAMGPAVYRDDPQHWKVILAYVADLGDEMSRAASLIENYLRNEAFIPDLRRMAADESLHHALRNAAVIALFAMGDESFADRLVEDLAARKPVFYLRTHRLVAKARGEDVAHKLVAAYEAQEDERERLARRIHDLDAPVSQETLVALVRTAGGHHEAGWEWLLKTLARRSPEAALGFVVEALEDPRVVDRRGRATTLDVLAGLDLPLAAALRRRVLLTFEPEDRARLIAALRGQATAGAHVPDLLLLVKGDALGMIRSEAERVLAEVTGLPEDGMHGKTAKEREGFFAQWEKWWEENGERFDR